MSTGHTPNPPDRPTGQAAPNATEADTAAALQPGEAQEQEALPLAADMARIFEEQIDIITQRVVYNTQMMLGVGAMGTDPVTARETTLIVANALRNQTPAAVEHSLVNLGDPQLSQVNDRTLPVKLNSQLAGLFEGILLETVSQAYKADPARQREARIMLQQLFQPANEAMQYQPKAMIAFQAPGPGPNARD